MMGTNALLDREGRFHPLRQMRYPLRVGEEADEGVPPWLEIDQDEVSLIAGRDGRRANERHLLWQIGTAGSQQIGRGVAGRETEHQHLVVLAGVISAAQDDVRI